MSFFCSQCGECCKNIRHIPELAGYSDENGCCKYLKNNRCSVYENRPEVCRVDLMYEKYYSNKYTLQEFYTLNESICEILQNNAKK
ncbi:MAG: YkgJ family cysteine cluster protein [Campylobacter sp.]|nr:YkgJ family cysteine cluster protein [Campylobacteraceae bacterium]MDY3672439.1 YkgJ family cysteine cluster protein [Campylobacter sp.]MDY5466195.1 YkgJ family cysteine cluster protein [Campylobacter sp.]